MKDFCCRWLHVLDV